jgi:hypothetical protein
VKDFLDFTVARAGRGGRFLRPRVAHRFGPPEHHIAASDDPLGADRANGDGVPPEGDSAGPRDAPGVPLTEVGRSPGGKARAETSWSRAQTGGATRGGAVPAGEGRGGPALPSFAAEPTAELPRGPAAASVSAPTNDSPAQDNFVELLRASLRKPRTARAAPAPAQRDRVVAAPSSGGDPLDVPASRIAPATTAPVPAKVKSRSAENEDAFWRFLYGSQAEAPTIRKRPIDEGRTGASAEGGQPGGPSPSQAGAVAVRGAAGATTTGAGAAARPMTVAVGRIDVRVAAPPVAPRPAVVPMRRSPRLGLTEYMRQSASGDRRR